MKVEDDLCHFCMIGESKPNNLIYRKVHSFSITNASCESLTSICTKQFKSKLRLVELMQNYIYDQFLPHFVAS